MIRLSRTAVLLIAVFMLGLIPRLWRINTDLMIHFDQGMHSQDVYDIWRDGKISLLGHMTDTDGIFHGPLYYWFMIPAYAVGGGDPAAAAVFQILLQMAAVFFLFDLARRLAGERAAWIASVLYSASYGYASYSRWLSNVTPALPFSVVFFWAGHLLFLGRVWALPVAAFLASVITQHNGAIGVFLYPILLWMLIASRTYKKVTPSLWLLSGVLLALPHIPLLLFELRHGFVVTRAILSFMGASPAGSGIPGGVTVSPSVWLVNLNSIFREMYHLTSYSWPAVTALLLLAGLVKIIKNRTTHPARFIAVPVVLFMFFLSFYRRGAIGFFLTPLFPLLTILIAWVISGLSRKVRAVLLVLLVGINVFHWGSFLTPSLALTPIGTANIITNRDRKNVVDWIYSRSGGKPFAVWIYTIPYFLDDPWTYYFNWYGRDRYGYLPESTANFSPGDLKQAEYFFNIYEPDFNSPARLENWLSHTQTNFGPVIKQYSSGGARVEQRTWTRN